MNRSRRSDIERPTVVVLASLILLWAGPALSICNLIPGTTQSFRARIGTVDRPFASPGDFVALRLSPVCDPTSTGFAATANGHVVTLVFTPPNDGPRNVIVLAANCEDSSITVPACAGGVAGGGMAARCCMQTDMELRELPGLNGQKQFRFRFPDTDRLFSDSADSATLNDDRTLTGPAAIAVTHLGSERLLALADPGTSCANQTGLVACVDDLFTIDGRCTPTAKHDTFTHFTALPPANDYQALCTHPTSVCTGLASEMHFTVDSDGNILIPMDWRGVLVGRGVPIARLLRGQSNVSAFAGGSAPLRIPSNAFLHSYTPEGGLLPPLFDPQADPMATDTLTLFGSADAPRGVLRLARRSPVGKACAGGTYADSPCARDEDCGSGTCVETACVSGPSAGNTCTADADCPESECGRGLFEFRTRLETGIGPVVLPRSQYTVVAKDPVPLDALVETNDLFVSVVPEAIEGVDLNGDGDTTDDVVLLADRRIGIVRPTGNATAPGRAAARIRELPYTFPALAVEGRVLAFLEPESRQGYGDTNRDGDTLDTILRVFRLREDSAEEITGAMDLSIDAASIINDRPVVISNGHVFFHVSEAAQAVRETTRASQTTNGEQGNSSSWASPTWTAFEKRTGFSTLSGDGRFVVFTSLASNLVDGDSNAAMDVFVHDRATGSTERSSIGADGQQANDLSDYAQISSDGRFVTFSSWATNLVPGDSNAVADVFVRDRQDGRTERASLSSNSQQGNARSYGSSISANGRFVAFHSRATNLVANDTNGTADVFVRDRLSGSTERVSVDSTGAQANAASEAPRLSADGRFVAFSSWATNLVPNDTNGTFDVFVHDRRTGTTERVSVDSHGRESEPRHWGFPSSISADGQLVTFTSDANNLVPGDTNDAVDVFVHDRLSRVTERVSIDIAGVQAASASPFSSISADGRFVAFDSFASLVPDDSNNAYDVFRFDRRTGLIGRASVSSSGLQGNSASYVASISGNGDVVSFSSFANNLVAADSNTRGDVLVHAPSPGSADHSGDGDSNDTLLAILDTSDLPASQVTLCPAGQTSVVGSVTAFLRPEAAGTTPNLAICPQGSATVPCMHSPYDSAVCPVLNDDRDVDDEVVHLWRGAGSVENLHCAATRLSLSSTALSALVSETAQGNEDLNGDGDHADTIVKVYKLGDPSPSACADWVNTGQIAEDIHTTGSTVVLLTPEAATGYPLNGDGDISDRVLQLYDAERETLTNIGQAAEDFVVNGTLIAFRTSEAAQGEILNDDNDEADDVLQVFDLATHQLINARQAVTPCRFEACDPRLPYRVLNDTVKFLTLEAQQGEDLNGDGDLADLVLQTFNVRLAQQAAPRSAPMSQAGASRTLVMADIAPALPTTATAAVNAGICTDNASACITNSDCESGTCFLPPGGCIKDLEIDCDPRAPGLCGQDRFCQPNAGMLGRGSCHAVLGACQKDMDCRQFDLQATCNDAGQSFQRLVGPLNSSTSRGQVFISAGRCIEPSGHIHGTCRTDDDCPGDSVCHQELVTATAADRDGDEILDTFDNCPSSANVLQEDSNDNGIGDLCDTAPGGLSLLTAKTGALALGRTAWPIHDPTQPVTVSIASLRPKSVAAERASADPPVILDGASAPETQVQTADLSSTSAGIETGSNTKLSEVPLLTSGNSIVGADEECDDGNVEDGDGCGSTCQIETCFDCSGQPSLCAAATPTLTVTTLDDVSAGSLRQTIAQACPGSVLTFAVTGTIYLQSGELVIDKDLTISGPGASLLTVHGNQSSRIFNVTGGNVAISGLTARNGRACGGAGIRNGATLMVRRSNVIWNSTSCATEGGNGIANTGVMVLEDSEVSKNAPAVYSARIPGGIDNRGTLTVSRSLISLNETYGSGGGLANSGHLAVFDSTISGNNAYGGGGAIYNSGTLSVVATTLVDNTATADYGAGIWSTGPAATIKNSFLSNPWRGSLLHGKPYWWLNCAGTIISLGHNLSDDATCATSANDLGDIRDPLVGPLADNGGPTATHALLPGNPGINAIPADACVDEAGVPTTTDQRGYIRPEGAACDIGALETSCGDGIKQASEDCDDGNPANGDGCRTSCVSTSCRDGKVDPNEQCDDWNSVNGDGCDANCELEPCFTCSGSPSSCTLRPQPITVAVTNLNDHGAGSLREAIRDACSGDMIEILPTGTIVLSTGDLVIDKDLRIVGPGASALAIDGGFTSRVFRIDSGEVTISGLTVTRGRACGGSGILNLAKLAIHDCTISGNLSDICSGGSGIENRNVLTMKRSLVKANESAFDAGGIRSSGTLTLINTTVTNNSAGGAGGGIYSSGTLRLFHTTVADNTSSHGGSGIHHFGTTPAEVRNTILGSAGATPSCSGPIFSYGHNIEDGTSCGLSGNGDRRNVAIHIGPLADHGGTTQTRTLLPGSPAINLVPSGDCVDESGGVLATDQRGTERPQGGACDAGAVESSCGDGETTDQEQCDDGNLVDGDGCDSNCTSSGCGNGVITDGEACDDGDTFDTNSCKSDCTINVCGDGFANSGVEECDDANLDDGDSCRKDCRRNHCGDGTLNTAEEYFFERVPFAYIDIASVATTENIGPTTGPVPLGFTFEFFGKLYSQIYLSRYGLVSFSPFSDDPCCSGQPLPRPGGPGDNLIAAYWTLLYGGLSYATVGNTFVIELKNVPFYGSDGQQAEISLQYQLYGTSNRIEFHYLDAAYDLGTTAGIENEDGSRGYQHEIGQPPLKSFGVAYVPGTEECDDGNRVSGDGCSAVCLREVIPAPETPNPTPPSSPTGSPSIAGGETATPTPTATPRADIGISGGVGRPGGLICLGVAMKSGTTSIAALHDEINFDASLLTMGACLPNPGTALPLHQTELSAGLHRIDLGDCQETSLADGPLYVCPMTIASDAAPGAYSIVRTPSAESLVCEPQPSNIQSSGQVIVTTCSGDCDGNGSVSIGEVMRCANRFLGAPACNLTRPDLSCPIADADNDGSVSIAEVQGCVNRFLGSCQQASLAQP